MDSIGNLTVEAVPGALRLIAPPGADVRTAGGTGDGGASRLAAAGAGGELSLPLPVWSPARLRETARRLGSVPAELYDLQRGRIPGWLREAGLLPDEAELAAWSELLAEGRAGSGLAEAPAGSVEAGSPGAAAEGSAAERAGRRGGERETEGKAGANRRTDGAAAFGGDGGPSGADGSPSGSAVSARRLAGLLESRPLLALALRGLPKRELLGGVFAAWAAAAPEADEGGAARAGSGGGLAAELARLERRGPGDQAGEWLSEAAAEGLLHQPGPQFREVRDLQFPAEPEVAAPSGAWQSLLPRTPKVEEGLSFIMRAVAAAAAERAKRLPK